ncbi:hypothetical protein Tco_1098344 [Tanacetum coccineum]
MITNNNNKTRGRTPAGHTLQGLVRRSHTEDLNPYALNETITTMVHVLPNATSLTELAIWPATLGVLQILMLVTIREARRQFLKRTWRLQRTKSKDKSLASNARLSLGVMMIHLPSDSNEQEYVMAVRGFREILKKRGMFVRQPYDDKKKISKNQEDKRKERRLLQIVVNPITSISDAPKMFHGDQKHSSVGSWMLIVEMTQKKEEDLSHGLNQTRFYLS